MDLASRMARLQATGLDPQHIVIEPLASHHDRAAFSCGELQLDDYIRTRVGQDIRRNQTRCHVLVSEPGGSRILGYYTLNAHALRLDEMSESLAKKLRAYPVAPAILLGRLAVDAGYQGSGLGWLLLIHALRACLDVSFQIGAIGVVVDALHERAASFYSDQGFTRVGDDPLRLYLPTATLKALFPTLTEALTARYGAPSNLFAAMDDTGVE